MDRWLLWLGRAIFAVALANVLVASLVSSDTSVALPGSPKFESEPVDCSLRVIEVLPGGSDPCGETARDDLGPVAVIALPALIVGVTSMATGRIRSRSR